LPITKYKLTQYNFPQITSTLANIMQFSLSAVAANKV